MAELLYQGHGSYRIVSNEGVVIYVDPYAGEGYDGTLTVAEPLILKNVDYNVIFLSNSLF